MAFSSGYLALVLHAHLPYVRHPEYENFLEEDWLYEAITETYIPLLQVMERLRGEGVSFRFSMTISPTLCSMLMDSLLQDRYVRYLEKLIEFCEREIDRTRLEPSIHSLAWFYHRRLNECRSFFVDRWKRNLIPAFREFQDQGFIEIITCSATHAFLPLMTDYPEAIRAQILIARDHYRECFGRDPKGIWLPECAYDPLIEPFLVEANLRWFVLDSHGVLFAEPRPPYGIYSPIISPRGVAAFGRDVESSQQVWSAEVGYPGDPDYREFYRDVGQELDYDYIRPYIQENGKRKSLGIKYHRITGRGPYKEVYQPGKAHAKAALHARDFWENRKKQMSYLFQTTKQAPMVLSPYDAELFGHWWYEGPEFLEALFRQASCDSASFRMIVPSEYLKENSTQPLATPARSSWGSKGYAEVWLEDSNAWIYPHLHQATQRMIELANQAQKTVPKQIDRALKQAVRELVLAQSSDWAFIMKTGTTVEYARKRTKDHLLRFHRLDEQIQNNKIDEDFLKNCEWRNPIFSKLDWRYFQTA